MIILDTNVISEVLKSRREPIVLDWLNQQKSEELFLTTISISELLFGAGLLPDGKRKSALISELNTLLINTFASRILPFDQQSAIAYGLMMSAARNAGNSISVPDGQIGAIASVYGFSVATRDTAPFLAFGLSVLNPWDGADQDRTEER